MKLEQLKEALAELEMVDNVKLSESTTILNGQKFVSASIKILEANKGKRTFLPYYERLLTYYRKLSE